MLVLSQASVQLYFSFLHQCYAYSTRMYWLTSLVVNWRCQVCGSFAASIAYCKTVLPLRRANQQPLQPAKESVMAMASPRLSRSRRRPEVTARLPRKTDDVTYQPPPPLLLVARKRSAPSPSPLSNSCESSSSLLLRCGATMALCRPPSYGLLCSFVVLLLYGKQCHHFIATSS